jgi:hypothetical protein
MSRGGSRGHRRRAWRPGLNWRERGFRRNPPWMSSIVMDAIPHEGIHGYLWNLSGSPSAPAHSQRPHVGGIFRPLA